MDSNKVPCWRKAEAAVCWSGKEINSNLRNTLAIVDASHDVHDGWMSKVEMSPAKPIEHGLDGTSDTFIAARDIVCTNKSVDNTRITVSPCSRIDCGGQPRDGVRDVSECGRILQEPNAKGPSSGGVRTREAASSCGDHTAIWISSTAEVGDSTALISSTTENGIAADGQLLTPSLMSSLDASSSLIVSSCNVPANIADESLEDESR